LFGSLLHSALVDVIEFTDYLFLLFHSVFICSICKFVLELCCDSRWIKRKHEPEVPGSMRKVVDGKHLSWPG